MLQREIEGAKRHPNSRARAVILERGIRAAAVLLLELLGEVEPEDEVARELALRDIRVMVEVVQ